MKRSYKWKRKPSGAPDANIVVKYIEDIKRRRGGITAGLLVTEAYKNKSPLHNCFEWDDTKAALQYRIVQAREILRAIVVEVEETEKNNEPTYTRYFIAPPEIEEAEGTTYVTVIDVRNNKELHLAYLRQLLRELYAIRDKIKGYKEFINIVSAIEAITI